jgi:hypothetical protein
MERRGGEGGRKGERRKRISTPFCILAIFTNLRGSKCTSGYTSVSALKIEEL